MLRNREVSRWKLNQPQRILSTEFLTCDAVQEINSGLFTKATHRGNSKSICWTTVIEILALFLCHVRQADSAQAKTAFSHIYDLKYILAFNVDPQLSSKSNMVLKQRNKR